MRLRRYNEMVDNTSGKKYKLLPEECITVKGHKLYAIEALRDIYQDGKVYIKKGTLGGWIRSESNLSQEGECWLGGDALAYENSSISGDVKVGMGCKLFGNAKVSGDGHFSPMRVGGNSNIKSKSDFLNLGYMLKKMNYDSSFITYIYADEIIYSDFFVGSLDKFKKVAHDLYVEGDSEIVLRILSERIAEYNNRK